MCEKPESGIYFFLSRIEGLQERITNMIDLKDKNNCPAIETISEYVRNPVFMQFCPEIRNTYQCNERIEYSSCSWEKGWNVKFK